MSDNEDLYNDGRDPETISAVNRQLEALGALKKKSKKHGLKKQLDSIDSEEIERLENMDVEELERELEEDEDLIAYTSMSPSLDTWSFAGGISPKNRARIEEEENELELE
jgi:hypothetical protein